ncbi:PREDICTED: epiplakin [Calidris pugnax]|uniref:epiplakin n=1 Tax=Calidris pugnax TaxID=198806 RepID=UPI00071E2C0A|nr:PREDICTED: epiplakin [Calidris pugnax]
MDASSRPSEAAGSIAGVYVEASKRIMSFYDATREHLLSLDSALCLLEAQAAMGFIADPVKKRHVSVAEAVQLGLVGLELKERLLSAEKAATGFVDPYTEEKISLYQAIQKDLVGRETGTRLLEAQMATGGIIDPATGCRLPADVACERGYLDEEMTQLLSDPSSEDSKGFLNPSTMERVTYMELLKRCVVDPASGFLLLPLQITFLGLAGRVSSRDLLDSGIISPETFRDLEEGRVSAQEVAENDSIQQFLRGTRSVAGVVLPSSERKSLYQALREHLLVPGAALMLLQVQASTCSLTDPIKNRSYSVDEAVRVGLVGPELHEKLSSAEKAITGYKDPCTGEMLSLFQAIRKGFVPKDHGICLLEAQMATGGIIAPGRHLRVPTETACKWGYLDEATRQLLSSPTDDMKGFFDPGSKEKLTYAALLKRCVTDPHTGLLLLPLGGESGERAKGTPLFFDHRTQMALENTRVPVALGKFKGKPVSLWKLLFSDYIQSEQRAALAQQYLAGTLSTQELGKAVSTAIEEMASTANVTFEGLRDRVTADQLLSSEIINKDLFKKLKEGETSAKEVVGMDTVKKYLQGTGSIGGLLLPDSQEKISIYQAKRKGLLRPGTSLILLEAQAATGFVIDPAANKRYSVDEALRANVIGPDVYDKLLTAEKSVTGYRDPYSGNKISLFQAMKKELIVKEHAIRLLEAQIATGGIIDPVNSHRIPVEVAYKRGYFDKKMNLILSDPSDDTKGFFDPNTHENLTYLQLKEKCITEPSTGLCLLPLNSRKRQFVDDTTRRVFRGSWLPVRFGRLRGEKVSVWDLLNSEYFSEGRRREIFNHYQLRKLTLEQIRIMLEEEMKKWAPIKFPAMRGCVSAYHLMETGVIDKALFEKVLEGSVTPEEVLHMDSVRKYLYGSGSIGGIVLQPSNQRISIYEAMKKNIMVPGVALPLLEAQAATGFIIDPVNNQKLCVDDAIKEGVIGPEVHEKLQHAEGAVTGYKDPFTGKKIPLFQAMKKGLIADKQAMQLMEVQMATGGIIDPTCGHYIPVEAAQERGCLDEDTNKVLSKASDSTRAFCVPDSKETVTYAELIKRCQKDEVSGFHLLPLPQTAAPTYTDEEIQQIFKKTVVKEKGVSLWELIHAGYFTEEQRRDFVERFRSEEMSLQQLVALVLRLVGEMEMKARSQITLEGLQGSVPAVWLLDAGIITEKTFEELAQGIKAPEEVAAMESVKKYLQGTGNIAGVFVEASKRKMSFYDAMKNNLLLPGAAVRLLEAQAATGYLTNPTTSQRLSVREAVKAAVVGEELTEKLLLAERAVTGYTDPYTGSSISLCQALRKELIPLGDAVPLLEAQLATGGVIDPIHHLHLPLQAACRYGFYDEELNQTLSQLDDTTRIFFDPNTKENVTYQQLKERCFQEAESGLWLLPLSENAMFCVDEQTMEVLKSVTVCVNIGRFKGQTVSVWDLLNSEYLSDSKRRELVQKYKDESAEVLHEIIAVVTTIIKETETQGKKFAFKGLRKRVSASDLFQSQLIDKKTLDELNQGKKTVKEVTEMDSVRRYLEGSNFIAGVLIQPSNEKMSIYQAMRKGILRPGTALVLLEAQAATGYIINPEKKQKFSVEEALKAGLIGGEIYEKLLCAEKAVTGYTDPYTKAPMSLFEAMSQGLIVKSHGIRLLEAQIATGGIIDPVHSHRIPVEVAYQRGYFNQEMNQILSDPTDDTKGFFDPNTHENLTYLQLLERCVQDSETGLYMLQVVKEGGKYFYIDEATKQVLRSKPLEVKVGKFKDQTVSVWEILCSHYISERKRKELVMQYKCKTLTLEDLIALILKIIEDTEQRAEALKLKGLRGDVSVSELFNSEIIDKKTLDQLQDGSLTLASLTKRDTIQRYLDGTGCIAGVLLPSRKEKMSIYHALEKGLLTEQCALGLLEAQAATGFLIDPLKNKKLSVDEAVSSGLVGSNLHEKLLSAEKAVTGYTDPHTGKIISLFQAMRQKITVKEDAIRLLEAQLATGGIIDPIHSHRLPVEVAYKRGYLDDDTFLLLSDPDHGSKGFIDPNTHEKISYSQLLQRCSKDRDTGLYLLQVMEKQDDYFYIDEQTKNALLSTKVQVTVGKYKGQELSLWELLCSEYITDEKRKELVKKYKRESHHIIQGIIETILNIIKEKEEDRSDVWFRGLRQQITASELLSAQIITEETMEKLNEGKETAQEIAQTESVRRYLEGTGSIAGVLVPSKVDQTKMEKMSIYQAMWKGILRPGTALVLLEAQAATGFIIDPLANKKLSVDEAISCGLVGSELQKKLLSAERSVTGYYHPSTGQKMSLFQAMKKELIVKEHGIRLLEAQIATGGIIDPVHSHRLPVEVAYQRGYLDREMSHVLSDPTDDTKGFFDPNTHENLTYLQLLRRCVPDPDTGLLMLQLMDKGSVLYQLTEDARKALQAARVTLSVGLFQGQSVTLWELLFSRYVPDHRRQDLLRSYKAGTLTVSEMITLLTAIVTGAEGQGHGAHPPQKPTQREAPPPPAQNGEAAGSRQERERELELELERSLKAHHVEVSAGGFEGRKVSLWELLFSQYVSQAKRQELLGQVRAGSLALDELARLLSVLIQEAVERSSKVKFTGLRRQVTASDLLDSGIIDKDTLADLVQGSKTVQEVTQMASVKRYLDGTGCIAGVLVPSKADPATMEKMSIYQAMWKGILRQGTALVLLEAQAATGFLVDPLANKKLSVDEAVSCGLVGSELHEKLLSAERAVTGYTDPYTGQQISLFQAMKKELIVKEHGIRLLEAQIATGGIIDPVHSHRLPVEVAYQRGYLDREMSHVLSDPTDDTKGFFDPNTHENLTYLQLLRRCVPDPDTGLLMLQLMDKGSVLYQLTEDARKALQAARVTLSVGLFQGQSVTLWELLFSRYVPDHRRQDLLRSYKAGTLTVSEMITLLTAIVTGAEGQGHGAHPPQKPTQREAPPPPAQNGEAAGSRQERERELELELERSLKAHHVEVSAGGFEGRKVSLWELLFSQYVSQAKRQELLGQVRAGSLALDELARLLSVLIQEAVERSSKVKFTGLRRQVTASDLLDSGIIDKDTLADLVQGSKTVQEVTQMASVKRYLDGTGCIAGVLVPSKADPATMEKMSIYQAMWKGILRQGTALVLLEAQAATGFLVDPLANKKLSVDEAVSCGLVGSELHEKLLSAERAVTGYTDPYTGQQISLFQAMKKELIVKEHGIRLLEAQIATGGIIDPVHSHRLPVEVAYQRGYLDREMSHVLSDPTDDTKGFFDPNTHENLTYLQLLRRCVPDPDTGLLMLQLMDKGSVLYQLTEDARKALQAARVTLSVGLFQGQSVTLWELLFSRYVPDHRRQDLLRSYKAGTLTVSEMITLLTAIVTGAWCRRLQGVTRRSAASRTRCHPCRQHNRPIITSWEDTHGAPRQQDCSPETRQRMSGAPQNNKSSNSMGSDPLGHKDMGEGGSNFIAGVFIQAKKKKMSIYDAMMRGLLTPGTALVLLEAQAASGFLTDPVRNEKLSVKAALSAGLIGRDFYEKLLSAEGAVTGYTEPYTGHKISLFQAMKKEFIVKEHATRLLEAQIATGGIIDPVNGHRLPVEVAYQRGFFDQEMCQFLSNPKNQTRSCFDPNTHENLTYLQLLRRCVPDPDTGLLMLQLMDKGSVLYQLTEDARKALQAARVTLSVGLFQGQSVTLWELLFSRYVPDHQREELLRKYKAGMVTIPEMITLLTTIVTGAEMEKEDLSSSTVIPNNKVGGSQPVQGTHSQEQQLRKSLKSVTIYVTTGEFQGQKVSLLDLLFSKYIPQEKRQELLELYRAGILTTGQVATVVTNIMNRTEAANAALTANARSPHKVVTRTEDNEADFSAQDAQLDNILKSTTIDVPAGEFQGRQVSVWDLLFSDYISEEKRQELLELYRERLLALEQMITVVTTLVKKKESTGRKFLIAAKASNKDTVSAAGEKDDDSTKEEPWEKALKTTVVDMEVGDFRGHKVSVWELLHSKYIPEENRKELLELYRGGVLTLEQVKMVVSTIVTKAEAARAEQLANASSPRAETTLAEAEDTHLLEDRTWEETLKSTMVEMAIDEFQGRQVSVWDLLFSDYISEEKRQELLELYRERLLALEQMITVVTTLVKKKESTGRKFLIAAKASNKDTVSAAGEKDDDSTKEEPWEKALKTTVVDMEVGDFRGHKVSVWELLHSKYIPEENRKELLELYRGGVLTLEQVKMVVSTIVTKAEAARAEQLANASSPRAETTLAEAEDTHLLEDRTWEENLKSTMVEMAIDEFQGRQVSVWDLLFSDYISEEKRQELLELYRAGTLPLERLIIVVTTLVKKKESTGRKFLIAAKASNKDTVSAAGEKDDDSTKEEPWEKALKTTVVDMEFGDFRGHKVSVWELLHSKYIPEENRKELLELYQAGELTLEQVKMVVSTIVTKAEAARAEQLANASSPRAETTLAEAEDTHLLEDRTWEETLKSTMVEMAIDEFQGRQVSVWDLLFSDYISEEKRQELLELYRAGTLPLERLIIVVTTLVKKKESTGRKFLIAAKASNKDTVSAAGEKDDDSTKEEPWEKALKTTVVDMEFGDFRGHKVSVWELLHSKYIPEENRKELLELYQAGELTLEQVKMVVSTIVTKAEAARAEQLANASSPRAETTLAEAEDTHLLEDRTWEETLKSTMVEMAIDEFQGRQVSVWDLLFSRYVPEEKRQELLELYRAGTLTLQELVATTTSTATNSNEGHLATLPQQTVDLLQSEGSYITFGPFQEQRVSVWELLSNKQVSEYKREAHLDTYGTGGLTVNKITITTTVITGPHRKKRLHQDH